MNSYSDLLNIPCRVINLEKNKERWSSVLQRSKDAGFTNVDRFDAIGPDRLKEGWDQLNNPSFAHNKDVFFARVLGKQGCFLSHMLLWKEIVDKKIPFMTIFEDDILFHELWNTLAPSYFKMTPIDFDILYLGSQFEKPSYYHIDRVPVYCLHAYVITFDGATKLYNMVLNNPEGVYTIDGILLEFMNKDAFNWYVWNGSSFYPSKLKMQNHRWNVRNNGLVFQDEMFGTDIL